MSDSLSTLNTCVHVELVYQVGCDLGTATVVLLTMGNSTLLVQQTVLGGHPSAYRVSLPHRLAVHDPRLLHDASDLLSARVDAM